MYAVYVVDQVFQKVNVTALDKSMIVSPNAVV
jgi:hypothetical protein